ncbi:MAG: hypothetical protein A3I05_09855 [Deltaproteobacteria bacterium RIFCSPLOWO2_02_FULL_44_10]|nr:MAG: hypothetical protein A3C46_09330 [Deltaproteobacteria bacterium RIFCSPHIGHO2_02_FULL_44_16]OGQ44998.1 MAG: hypothetical protein A3I05_09855 [Deltaproteobacteria bacterium RIFCSPLOWO2_02_FULL_44_10]
MPYHVELETKALKEFRSLPKEIQRNFADIIKDLEQNPRPPGIKKLTNYEGYRVRSGTYRLLYTIEDKSKLVRIYRIGHRREIYR